MLEIDGSMGEGGGQILRSALSLSVILGEPVRITRIRAKRPNPGLKPQHLTSVKALAEIGNAEARGARIGSKEIVFIPSGIHGGNYEFDTGTAGSITLLIQAILPALVSADSPSTVVLRGGTDVKWSPPADHTKYVLLPALSRMGAKVEMEIVRRGYYPKGGGEVLLRVTPSKLKALSLKGGWPDVIEGNVHCSNLPEHVPRRIGHAAIKELIDFRTDISVSWSNSLSTGVGIVLWSEGEGFVIGGSALGEIGLPSEKVGKMAADDLKKAFGYGVDMHLADQLLIYLAIAGGEIFAPEISFHARTGMKLIEMMSDRKFSIEEERGFVVSSEKA